MLSDTSCRVCFRSVAICRKMGCYAVPLMVEEKGKDQLLNKLSKASAIF